jgi:hypothetical protein
VTRVFKAFILWVFIGYSVCTFVCSGTIIEVCTDSQDMALKVPIEEAFVLCEGGVEFVVEI